VELEIASLSTLDKGISLGEARIEILSSTHVHGGLPEK
jgi:hypothetical protein